MFPFESHRRVEFISDAKLSRRVESKLFSHFPYISINPFAQRKPSGKGFGKGGGV